MSAIPQQIEGLGSSTERLRQNPQFDPAAYRFTSDSYFIWSRLDGHTSLRDVILMVGLPVDQTVTILRELRACGAVLRPGENAESVAHLVEAAKKGQAAAQAASRLLQVAAQAASKPAQTAAQKPPAAAAAAAAPAVAAAAAAAPAASAAAAPAPSSGSDELGELSAEEHAAMQAQVALTPEVKRRILLMRRRVLLDYFTLLGVAPDIDKRALKRVYFSLSKEFHPDRYFGKDTGPFGPWLTQIFAAISKAFELLSDDRQRARYAAELAGAPPPAGDAAQSRAEYAKDLFDRACDAEHRRDYDEAIKLFTAALRLDASARYLTRAARCAIAAGRLDIAEDFSRKALELEPDSPSIARLLAAVYRAGRRLKEAEETLMRAYEMNTENDMLAKEIQADLAAVRAEIGSRAHS